MGSGKRSSATPDSLTVEKMMIVMVGSKEETTHGSEELTRRWVWSLQSWLKASSLLLSPFFFFFDLRSPFLLHPFSIFFVRRSYWLPESPASQTKRLSRSSRRQPMVSGSKRKFLATLESGTKGTLTIVTVGSEDLNRRWVWCMMTLKPSTFFLSLVFDPPPFFLSFRSCHTRSPVQQLSIRESHL